MKAKTVLISGAYGFIGRYTAKYFCEQGWKVIGLGHGTWSKREWSEWGVSQWHECDITLENLVIYGGTPEVIVHCAGSGSVSFSVEHPMQDFERTVKTTQYILEFVRLHSPKTSIVYPSSAAVYGDVSTLPIHENSLLKPISPYGLHKKIAEELCSLYAKQYHLSVAIVRLFSVYGIGLGKQLLWDACNKLEYNDTVFFGTGLETRDWVHIQDVSSLLYIAQEKSGNYCQIVNGGSGVGISVQEILSVLFLAFGRTDHPKFLGAENIGNPVHYQADVHGVREWGWEPRINLKQGIEEYVKWYIGGAV